MQSSLTGSMLARKPITALMVSASSFLPVIKVISILCHFCFKLDSFSSGKSGIWWPKAATLIVILLPVAFLCGWLKCKQPSTTVWNTMNQWLRPAQMYLRRLSTGYVAILSAGKDEREKERNQSHIPYHQGRGQFNSLNDMKLVLLNVSWETQRLFARAHRLKCHGVWLMRMLKGGWTTEADVEATDEEIEWWKEKKKA